MPVRKFNSRGEDITDFFNSPEATAPQSLIAPRLSDPNYKPPTGADIIKSAAKKAARIAGGALPMVGGVLAGVPGVGAGTAIDAGLRSVAPDYFGEAPKDVTDVLTDVGGNVAIDAGLGLAGKFTSMLPRKYAIPAAGAGAVVGDQFLSDDNSTLGDRALNATMGATVAGGLTGAARSGANRLLSPALRSNAKNIAEGMDAMGAPLTVPNISENPLVRRLVDVLAPETAQNVYRTQERAGSRFLQNEIPTASAGPEFTGGAVQSQINEGNTNARNIKNAAWAKLSKSAEKVKQYPQIGAILGQTVASAESAIENIFKTSVPGYSNKTIRETMRNLNPNYESLFDTLDALKTTQGADPTLIQNLKSVTGDLGNYSNPHPTRVELGFRQVSEALRDDLKTEYGLIDQSIKQARRDATKKLAEARKRDPNGTFALNDFLPKELHGTGTFSIAKDYENALQKSSDYMQNYGKRDANETFKFLTTDNPGKNLKTALKDADSITSAITASRSPEVTRGLLGEQWLANIFDKSFKGSTGSQTNTLIDMLKNTNEQGKLGKLFTPQKRQQLEKVGDAMSSIPRTGDTWQSVGNVMRLSGAGLALGIGATSALSEDHHIPLGPAGVLAIGLGGHLLARKLLDDGFAKMIIRNAGTKAARLSAGDSAILMQTLRGEEVFLMTPKGKVEGSISDEGKFVQKADVKK